MMNYLQDIRKWILAYHIDLLRIYIGLFLFLKGIYFLLDPSIITNLVTENKILFWNSLLAHYVVLCHLVGGAFLMIGLLTRLSALVQVPILIGAVFIIHLKEGYMNYAENLEYASLMLVLLIIYSIIEPGKLSVDQSISSER